MNGNRKTRSTRKINKPVLYDCTKIVLGEGLVKLFVKHVRLKCYPQSIDGRHVGGRARRATVNIGLEALRYGGKIL